jgi:hypothetical protein
MTKIMSEVTTLGSLWLTVTAVRPSMALSRAS